MNNKIINLSSRWTVILKYFLPTFWLSFFGALTMGFFKLDESYIFGFPASSFKIGMILFLLVGLAFFYFAFFHLKRVEANDRFLHVTNYRKAYRYPFSNIEKIEKSRWLLFKTYTVHLKTPGSFGKKITFIGGRKGFGKFTVAYPEFEGLFVGK